MPFPNQVNQTQAIAIEGDFASSNPRRSVVAGQGSYVAGSNGVIIGRWCWEDAQGLTVANTGVGSPTGFLSRTGNMGRALITTYLTESGNVIPAGFDITLHDAGDYYVKNAGGSAVAKGMKVYANLATGVSTFAAAGTVVAGAIETIFYAASVGAAGEIIKIVSAHPVGA